MNAVETLRGRFAACMLIWVWGNTALLALVASRLTVAKGTPVIVLSVGLSAAATLAWSITRTGWPMRQISSVVVTVQVALLVYLFIGHTYQIEMHLYFFATLAVLCGWLDWRVFATCTIVIAIHHGALSQLYSDAVFPGGGDLSRVMVHAAIVVLQTVALGLLVEQLRRSLVQSDADEELAREAQYAAEEAREQLAEATREAEQLRSKILKSVAEEFESQVAAIAADVSASVSALRGSALQMSASAQVLTAHCESAAQSSQDASTNVLAVDHATDNLASSIGQIDHRIAEAARIVATTSQRVEDALRKVDRLSANAQDVGTIATLISAIAERTNLLALNATIEAARAGEYGRGFRIVAGEVKDLSSQTATAADDILRKIELIRSSGHEATQAIDTMNVSIASLSDISQAVADVMEQQSDVTKGIAGNARQAAERTVIASGSMQVVSRIADETGQVAYFIAGSADALATRADQLDAAVTAFLSQVRAA